MRYYFGNNLGTVQELTTATNFKELVGRILNCPVPLPITKEEFFALSEDEQNEQKQVSYLTAATFVKSPCPRRTEFVDGFSLIFFDIDPLKSGDPGPAVPIYKNPHTLFDQLHCPFALYQTARSTPDTPRLRLVIGCEHMPTQHYREAQAYIANAIGLSHITRESGVVCQAMYRPVVFRNQTDHPLMVAQTEKPLLTLGQIRGSEFLHRPDETDPIEFLRARLDKITLPQAKKLLENLNPDCSYHEWLEIAAGIKHQFPTDGFELFDGWSSRGQKYRGQDETQAKWDSFRPSPPGRLPTTFRTILHKAKKVGVDLNPIVQLEYESCLQKIREAKNLSTLLERGPEWIAATPQLMDLQKDALINQIVKVAKNRFSTSINVAACRKAYRKVLDRIAKAKTEAQNERQKELPEWARALIYVSGVDEFYNSITQERTRPQALDRVYAKHLLPSDEQLEEQGNLGNLTAAATPWIEPQKYLLNHVQIERAYDYAYEPQQAADVFIATDGQTKINIYSPSYPQPDHSRAEEAGETITNHLEKLIGEKLYRRLLLDFLAHNVQLPGVKIRWAPLLQGVEGCGKSVLTQLMQIALGPSNVGIIMPEQVFQGWSEWLFGKCLIVMDETRVVGHNRFEVMTKTKPMITNDMVPISQKFRDKRDVPNKANFIFFTNHHDALPVDSNDRRYMVIKSPLQTKDDLVRLGGEKYFTPLYEQIEGNAAGVRAFFESWKISDDFAPNGRAPQTIYHQEMESETEPETVALIRDLIEDPEHPLIDSDLISTTAVSGLIAAKPQQIAQALRYMGYKKFDRVRHLEQRHQIWGKTSSPAFEIGWKDIIFKRIEKSC